MATYRNMNPFAGIPMFLIRVLSVSISSHPLKLIIDIIIILDFIVISHQKLL